MIAICSILIDLFYFGLNVEVFNIIKNFTVVIISDVYLKCP
jgi:hypothetical protein